MCSPQPRHCISQTLLDCYHPRLLLMPHFFPELMGVTNSISGTMKMFGRDPDDPDCPGLGDSTNLETSHKFKFNYTTWRYTH